MRLVREKKCSVIMTMRKIVKIVNMKTFMYLFCLIFLLVTSRSFYHTCTEEEEEKEEKEKEEGEGEGGGGGRG